VGEAGKRRQRRPASSNEDSLGIEVIEVGQQQEGCPASGTVRTYRVREGDREFIIAFRSHPHHGSSLLIAGRDGTLHIRSEDNRVISQTVAPGGGCALIIREEVVEGLSPAALRAVMSVERTRKND
jgi:hypothetical protein